MVVHATNSLIAVGCNPLCGVVAWAPTGLVAYGADRSIALFSLASTTAGQTSNTAANPCGRGVFTTLHGHEGRWTCTSVLAKHTASVTTIAILPAAYGSDRAHILVSAASDGTIIVWTCLQIIPVGARYATALAMARLPGTQVPILVSAGTDFRISLYTLQKDQVGMQQIDALQGHADWIRDLQFVRVDSTAAPELLLASASQDRYIRLWRVAPLRFSVMLDAVLQGHDDWVYSVCWHPRVMDAAGKLVQPMRLLSASADKSAILWAPDEATGVWLPQSRVGDIDGTSLGFYGALFNGDGSSILAHDYHGAFHLWSPALFADDIEQWAPQVCVGGHFKSVQGMAWHPKGQYLLSTSLDQTTRLFGPWTKNGTQRGWYEMARPQVHGYDLQCATFTGDYQFASGADEKVVRVFDAPASFVRSLAALTEQVDLLADVESRPAAANLPPLGLSNKAVESHADGTAGEGDEDDGDEAAAEAELMDQGAFRGQSYALSRVPGSSDELPEHPPLDEQLQQLTLWPETEKLYGHGFEIIAVAASHDGRFLATACRATGPEHAVVRLFDARTWKELPDKLAAHTLTITKIRFSPDDRYMLTVSRDRSWALFSRNTESEQAPYQLEAKGVKAHTRIIWDASWSPDGRYFATASRDKTVKLWQLVKDDDAANATWRAVATLQCSHSVTSIDFAPSMHGAASTDRQVGTCAHACIGTNGLAHASTVQSLLWRPSGNHATLQLASCGQDHSVRLFDVTLN
ncbi:WD40-repeat-containing domain protein [Syncephalis pseudoplumigaleata]|uniref:Elongator complex protein 2 n=1 Tax=Syncephalis pseudoplumigaleata TaxID=1712513 RepID=A0A4P9Z1S4_9FUNG|nr:WD40-repeat-containing domain protein [Syncephalis pseudoplumigaleata]|eukprot:RKP26433.1 WD40-repeat-containing domain protein [Syncephalis pseudoplumigaleata]